MRNNLVADKLAHARERAPDRVHRDVAGPVLHEGQVSDQHDAACHLVRALATPLTRRTSRMRTEPPTRKRE